jgi:hypothetical protein
MKLNSRGETPIEYIILILVIFMTSVLSLTAFVHMSQSYFTVINIQLNYQASDQAVDDIIIQLKSIQLAEQTTLTNDLRVSKGELLQKVITILETDLNITDLKNKMISNHVYQFYKSIYPQQFWLD